MINELTENDIGRELKLEDGTIVVFDGHYFVEQESCKHVYGIRRSRYDEITIESSEIRGRDIYQSIVFKYCPGCGKRLVD